MANHCSMVRDSALCVLHLSLKHLRVDKALLPGIGQIPKDTMIISPKYLPKVTQKLEHIIQPPLPFSFGPKPCKSDTLHSSGVRFKALEGLWTCWENSRRGLLIQTASSGLCAVSLHKFPRTRPLEKRTSRMFQRHVETVGTPEQEETNIL